MGDGYRKIHIKIRGQLLTICFRDFGLISDPTFPVSSRCIDWFLEEPFEFKEGEEFDVERWLAKHIDGEPVGMHLESLHSVEYGDGE